MMWGGKRGSDEDRQEEKRHGGRREDYATHVRKTNLHVFPSSRSPRWPSPPTRRSPLCSSPVPFLLLTVSCPSSRHGCSTSILIFSLTLPGVCRRVRGPIKSCMHPIRPGPSSPPPFPVSVPAWLSEESDPVRTLAKVGLRFELFHLLLR